MNLIKVAAGLVNQTPLAREGTIKEILLAVSKKQKKISQSYVCPSYVLGYGCEGYVLYSELLRNSLRNTQDR
jgi:NAD+ synthase (glutamine-hydrolysing)